MSESNQHSELVREALHEVVGFDQAGSLVGHTYEQTYHVIAQHADHALAALQSLIEQLEAAQKVLRMIGECGDALVEDGYGYLVVEASDALGSNPASDSPSLREQLEALRLVVAQQLTPLDVAATHIDILRRKGDEYGLTERDNVGAIVEQHVREARAALFASLSNPASEPEEEHHA